MTDALLNWGVMLLFAMVESGGSSASAAASSSATDSTFAEWELQASTFDVALPWAGYLNIMEYWWFLRVCGCVDRGIEGDVRVAVVIICRYAASSVGDAGQIRLEADRMTVGRVQPVKRPEMCSVERSVGGCSPPVQVSVPRRLRKGVPRDSVAIRPGTLSSVQRRWCGLGGRIE